MTREQIENLYKSGTITFQEALDLNSGLQVPRLDTDILSTTKEEMVDDFIDTLFNTETAFGGGKIDSFDVVYYLNSNNILLHGEKPTSELVEEEIKTFVFEALTNCLSSVAGGAKKEDCHWIIESDWLMVEVWFDADGKTIEVATRFVPQSGYKKFNYDKYKVLKHDNEVNPDF